MWSRARAPAWESAHPVPSPGLASNVLCDLSQLTAPLDKFSKSAEPSETSDSKRGLTAAIWCPPIYFLLEDSNASCPHHTPLGGWCCLCTGVSHVLLMSAQLCQLRPMPPMAAPVSHICLLSLCHEPLRGPGQSP